jgi:hypothetical protein
MRMRDEDERAVTANALEMLDRFVVALHVGLPA